MLLTCSRLSGLSLAYPPICPSCSAYRNKLKQPPASLLPLDSFWTLRNSQMTLISYSMGPLCSLSSWYRAVSRGAPGHKSLSVSPIYWIQEIGFIQHPGPSLSFQDAATREEQSRKNSAALGQRPGSPSRGTQNSIFELFCKHWTPTRWENLAVINRILSATSVNKGCHSHLLFLCSASSNSLQPHGLQRIRLPCPSLSPGVCSNSWPLSLSCYPTIPSSSEIAALQCELGFPRWC